MLKALAALILVSSNPLPSHASLLAAGVVLCLSSIVILPFLLHFEVASVIWNRGFELIHMY